MCDIYLFLLHVFLNGFLHHTLFPKKLGEYQMPKNALPMVESGVSTQSTYDR